MKKYRCFVRKHSLKNLEMKAEYPILSFSRQEFHCIDYYFFLPSQLHVTAKRIGVQRFLNSIKINTRLSSPVLSMEQLLDPSYERSPLTRVFFYLHDLRYLNASKKDLLLHELQTIVNIYRVKIDRDFREIKKNLLKKEPQFFAQKKVKNTLEEVAVFLKKFRFLAPHFKNPELNERQKSAFNWADEALSIITEKWMFKILSLSKKTEVLDSFVDILKDTIVQETEYRRRMNYLYLYVKEDPRSGEHLAYRESVLKKWSQSAMYMNSEDSNRHKRIQYVFAGIAAGIAMIFAVLLAIFAEKIFTRNSASWIFLIVLSYMFKDRIKETLREFFGRLFPHLMIDQLTHLFDPATGKTVGSSRGSVRFEKVGEIPQNIRKIRYEKPNLFRSILPDPDIVHYRRTIKIHSKKMQAHHSRLNGITEIIRLNIDNWLQEMDDPEGIAYRLEEGEQIKIKGARVYMIHLVLHLHGRSAEKENFYHYKIVVNKTGILRIETLKKEFQY